MKIEEEVKFLRKVIKAQDELLKCYRFGGHPSEWCFDIMAKFRELDKTNPQRSHNGNEG